MVRSVDKPATHLLSAWRHVNLHDWECTCQEWQDCLFPCVHSIHAAELDRRHVDTLYDAKHNVVEQYNAAYMVSFTPWPQEASPLDVDTSLKTPLDLVLVDGELGRRKPGPHPKAKKAKPQHQVAE